jgi:hypothetical protein
VASIEWRVASITLAKTYSLLPPQAAIREIRAIRGSKNPTFANNHPIHQPASQNSVIQSTKIT